MSNRRHIYLGHKNIETNLNNNFKKRPSQYLGMDHGGCRGVLCLKETEAPPDIGHRVMETSKPSHHILEWAIGGVRN